MERQTSRNWTKLLPLCAVLVTTAAVYSVTMQGGQPPKAPWNVADNSGPDTLYENNGQTDKTVTVKNDGPDQSIKVRIRNSAGGVVSSEVLEANDSYSGDVPAGGSIEVEDVDDGDANGASGEWWFA